MKCPKCGKEGAKYVTRGNTSPKIHKKDKRNDAKKRKQAKSSGSSRSGNKEREDFTSKCNKCGWKGVI